MVRGVPQNDVDQGPGARANPIRSPDAGPCGSRDAIHQRQRARSLQLELRYQFLDAAQVELALWSISRLVKAGQLCDVAAADSKQPVGKDPLRIQKVADHLLDRPLSFRISKHRARFAQPRTEGLEFDRLCLKMAPDSPIGKGSKEVFVERGSFLRRWRRERQLQDGGMIAPSPPDTPTRRCVQSPETTGAIVDAVCPLPTPTSISAICTALSAAPFLS